MRTAVLKSVRGLATETHKVHLVKECKTYITDVLQTARTLMVQKANFLQLR